MAMKKAVVSSLLISIAAAMLPNLPAGAQGWMNRFGLNQNSFNQQQSGWNQNPYNGNSYQTQTQVNPNIANTLRDVERTSDQLQKNVQTFLQMNGRYFPAPRGNDAALLMTLDAMK